MLAMDPRVDATFNLTQMKMRLWAIEVHSVQFSRIQSVLFSVFQAELGIDTNFMIQFTSQAYSSIRFNSI